jgi:hypothetical protein
VYRQRQKALRVAVSQELELLRASNQMLLAHSMRLERENAALQMALSRAGLRLEPTDLSAIRPMEQSE